MQSTKILCLVVLCCCFSVVSQAQNTLKGTVKDNQGNTIPGALISIKSLSKATVSEVNGQFQLSGDFEGNHTVTISFLGFKTYRKAIVFGANESKQLNIVLLEDTEKLETVVVSAKSRLQEIEATAFNVDVLNTEKLKNTTLSTGAALNRVSGVRVRQSGGLGSRMNLSLNGFTGNQVKVFIDGVPMENFGSSFQLNNIPVNMTKRIEVYKGVVPVSLGADALGGAINIVTNTYAKSHLNLSYSLGSFNTHQSSLDAVYVVKSGFTAQLQAFQNYSKNNYWVNVDVANIETGKYFPDQRVRRFHDTYHNETLIAKVGVVNKKYADQLLFGITLGQNYNEMQTGARLVSVFGSRHTEGNIIMPTLRYKKSDFFLENMDVNLTANYNLGKEKIIDTLHRRYNWFGDYKEYEGEGGESSYSLYEYGNNTGVLTTTVDYDLNDKHSLALSDALSTFDRKGSDKLDPDNEIYQQPRKTLKNVLGLSYLFEEENWSTSAFVKHYTQINKYAQSYNPTGEYGDIAYRNRKNNFGQLGYGITGTYFITDNFQVKASYEKSYRLPSATELFGNVAVSLDGNVELEPEKSDNYNLGASYWTPFEWDHRFNVQGNVFYRDAIDFIRPILNNNQATQVMDNLASVTNLGVAGEVGYTYKNDLGISANITYQNLRNNTRFEGGQTSESVVYRDRIPNMPYLFGNVDAFYSFNSPLQKSHDVRLGYHMVYVHSFYLFWPSLGSSKFDVDKQISHNLNLTYTLGKKDHVQLTVACRNLTDNRLYDNFSLQKPGRSFYGKINYTF